MKKTHFLKHSKLALASASLLLILAACGGGGSSSDADTNNNENNAEAPAPNNNQLQLPDTSAGDNCKLINVILNPSSGATLRRSSRDELLVTIDFEVLKATENLFIEAIFKSIDGNDGGITTFSEDIKQYNVGPGRIIDDIRFRVTDFDNDRYTSLHIRGYADTRGCSVVIPVQYIVTD